MIRILIPCAAVVGLMVSIQANASDHPDNSVMAASKWVAYPMLSSQDRECLVDIPAQATHDSTSRLSAMLSQHRVITRLPFSADVPGTHSEPDRVERRAHVGHCS